MIGKSTRYCNPLNPLPLKATSQDGSAQGVNVGGVTVVRGGVWVSRDFG